MIPAIIASVVVLYVYWQRKNTERPKTEEHAGMEAIRDELAALDARLDGLQKRLASRT